MTCDISVWSDELDVSSQHEVKVQRLRVDESGDFKVRPGHRLHDAIPVPGLGYGRSTDEELTFTTTFWLGTWTTRLVKVVGLCQQFRMVHSSPRLLNRCPHSEQRRCACS